MDPIVVFVLALPHPYGELVLAVIGACSLADAVVPPVVPESRWAIPRAILHLLGANFDKAARALGRRGGEP